MESDQIFSFASAYIYTLFGLIEILKRWLFLSAFYFWWCGLHVFELLLGFIFFVVKGSNHVFDFAFNS